MRLTSTASFHAGRTDRRDRRRRERAQRLRHLRHLVRRVLGVDEDPVERRIGEHLRHRRGARCCATAPRAAVRPRARTSEFVRRNLHGVPHSHEASIPQASGRTPGCKPGTTGGVPPLSPRRAACVTVRRQASDVRLPAASGRRLWPESVCRRRPWPAAFSEVSSCPDPAEQRTVRCRRRGLGRLRRLGRQAAGRGRAEGRARRGGQEAGRRASSASTCTSST